MVRGFTLLELLITLAVLAVLLMFAAPSFERFSQQNQMQSLASELQGFMLQAKSEAVFRNQDLWAHFVMDSNPSASGQWTIVLKDSDSPSSGNTILLLSGRGFRNISLESHFSPNKIKFDGVRGKVVNGSLSFHLVTETSKELKLRTSYSANRVMICGNKGALYGYPACT